MSAGGSARGHRALPHTADIRIEAWGPTREACLAEAVAAVVDGFADTADLAGAPAVRAASADLDADTDEDALLAVLDEVIYLLDTEDAVPVTAEIERTAAGVRARMRLVSVRGLDLGGAIPKAVSLSGLSIGADGDRWSCTATIDV
ncbi:archease [Gandjariella thermophila]|uniref:Archease domain-containing protein n=1 Tax=Gandjariella thermophila TaxID=1931992 RepID=A0A4D4JE12_9PSEU|nr:archease [Gandjariella thermophila]GDY32589.1 hypothetical protein GTS_42220 [Gandjariella thermophila]